MNDRTTREREIAQDKRETAAEHRAVASATDDPNVRRRSEVQASRLEDSARLHDALAHLYAQRESGLPADAPLLRRFGVKRGERHATSA